MLELIVVAFGLEVFRMHYPFAKPWDQIRFLLVGSGQPQRQHLEASAGYYLGLLPVLKDAQIIQTTGRADGILYRRYYHGIIWLQ
jgi:hypothetical protein